MSEFTRISLVARSEPDAGSGTCREPPWIATSFVEHVFHCEAIDGSQWAWATAVYDGWYPE